MTLPKLEQMLVREESLQGVRSVVIATINRPEALNALNATVLKSLDGLINWIIERNSKTIEVRALVLTGSGEKAFVAGADIKQFEEMDREGAAQFAHAGQKLFTRLEEMQIPTMAAVNGFALGGGLELALACDFIYAAENAKFGLPECTLGIMPGFGGTVRLPRRVGPARAREMTFTGAMITAPEALAYGLANKVVPQGELLGVCLETCKTMNQRAPLALDAIKRSIHQGMDLTEEKANELEAELFGELFATQDRREGVRAFIEKRKPAFQGK